MTDEDIINDLESVIDRLLELKEWDSSKKLSRIKNFIKVWDPSKKLYDMKKMGEEIYNIESELNEEERLLIEQEKHEFINEGF